MSPRSSRALPSRPCVAPTTTAPTPSPSRASSVVWSTSCCGARTTPGSRRSSRRPSSSEETSIEQDPLGRATELLAAARQANEVGRFADAAALLDEALALLAPAADVEARTLRTRVLITRSWAELETRGLEPALAMLRRARRAGEELGDPVLVALSHVQEGTVQGRVGDWSACLAALDRVGSGENSPNPAQRCALH